MEKEIGGGGGGCCGFNHLTFYIFHDFIQNSFYLKCQVVWLLTHNKSLVTEQLF